jgi:hypothetical protein
MARDRRQCAGTSRDSRCTRDQWRANRTPIPTAAPNRSMTATPALPLSFDAHSACGYPRGAGSFSRRGDVKRFCRGRDSRGDVVHWACTQHSVNALPLKSAQRTAGRNAQRTKAPCPPRDEPLSSEPIFFPPTRNRTPKGLRAPYGTVDARDRNASAKSDGEVGAGAFRARLARSQVCGTLTRLVLARCVR